MVIHHGGISPWLTSQRQPDLNYNLCHLWGGKSPGDLVFTSNGFPTLGQGSGPVHIQSLRWITGVKMESLLLSSHWSQHSCFLILVFNGGHQSWVSIAQGTM